MPINTPYASIAEADLTLGDKEPWFCSEDPDKQRALELARSYIDSKYSCIYFDEDNAPDPIKIANAELANYYLTSPTTFFGDQSLSGLKKKKVKAGSVESEKEYDSYDIQPADLYPDVTAMLTEYCQRVGTTNFVTR